MAVKFSRLLMIIGLSAVLIATSTTAYALDITAIAQQAMVTGGGTSSTATIKNVGRALGPAGGYTAAQTGQLIAATGMTASQMGTAFSGSGLTPTQIGEAVKTSGLSITAIGGVINGLNLLPEDVIAIMKGAGYTQTQVTDILSHTNMPDTKKVQVITGITNTTGGTGGTTPPPTTSASTLPPTCDPKYWESLKAKAWAGAQRLVEQNQNYIYKADSVLQYTCFDQFLNTLTAAAPQMFSQDSAPWGTTGGNMRTALQALVADSLSTYLGTNFSHKYLGDFSSFSAPTAQAVTAGGYNCNQMQKVWIAAKCQDFANKSTANGKADTSANTDFFTMASYSGNDYRKYPGNSVCQAANTWATQLSVAANTGTQYPKEKFNTYTKFFKPTSCSDPGIIPTGVTIKRSGGSYPEIVCVAPGCAPNEGGTACQ